MKSNYWLASLVGFFVLIGLSACGVDLAGDITPPPGLQSTGGFQPVATSNSIEYPLVPPDVADGQILYTEHCAPCHGTSGLGNGPQAANIPNPVAPIGQPSMALAAVPADWYEIITNGNLAKFMPGFIASLDDRQRWDILAYVYSLSMGSTTLSNGQKVYEANCATCHGPTGKGNGPQAANLSAAVPDFTTQDRLSQKSANDLVAEIKQGLPPMPAFEGVLSEADIQAVTSYVRALTFTNVPGLELASSASSTPGTPTNNITVIATSQATAASPSPIATQQPSAPSGTGIPQSGTPGGVTAGMVHGKIIMPADFPLPGGLKVDLTGYDSSLQPVSSASTPVQPDGTYLFSNVEMPAGQVFMTSVVINKVTFNSNVSSSTSSTDIDLPITVYDLSTRLLTLDSRPSACFHGLLYPEHRPGDRAVCHLESDQ